MKAAFSYYCCGASVLICLFSGILGAPHDPTDIVKSGPYYIGNCGSKKPGGGDAQQFAFALESVRITLDFAVKEMSLISTAYGFDNFFKFPSSIEPVRNLYQNILDGKDVLYQYPEAGMGPVGFVCIYPDDPYSQDTHDKICNKADSDGAATLFSSYGGGKHIFVCPAFFDISFAQKPPPAYCPRVVGTKSYPNDEQLIDTRFGFLARVLAYVYLGAKALENEPKVQDAINLDPYASLRNPASYSFFLSAIAAHCTDWPPPPY